MPTRQYIREMKKKSPISKVKRMKLLKEVNNAYFPPSTAPVDNTVVDPVHVLIYPSTIRLKCFCIQIYSDKFAYTCSPTLSDPRIYLIFIIMRSALTQQEFVSVLPPKDTFKEYYKSCSRTKKDNIDNLFQSCERAKFQWFEVCMELARPFHDVYMLLSSENCPCGPTLWVSKLYIMK